MDDLDHITEREEIAGPARLAAPRRPPQTCRAVGYRPVSELRNTTGAARTLV